MLDNCVTQELDRDFSHAGDAGPKHYFLRDEKRSFKCSSAQDMSGDVAPSDHSADECFELSSSWQSSAQIPGRSQVCHNALHYEVMPGLHLHYALYCTVHVFYVRS